MLFFENKKKADDIINDLNNTEKISINKSILIYGDNLIALKKIRAIENIDLVYIDPPFNTQQTFSVSNERTSTISRGKKGDVAYCDELSKEEFLSFMYERFVILHNILSEEGSLYVHIDYKMGHYFKVLLDEIFGDDNYKNDITRVKSNPKNFSRRAYGNQKDMILFYAKNGKKNIWNDIRVNINEEDIEKKFQKIDSNGRRYTTIPLHAPGETSGVTGSEWRGMKPPAGRHWRTDPKEFDKMDKAGLIEWSSTGNPRIKKYADEHKGMKIQDIWEFKDPQYPIYPTEKNLEMLDLIVKQSSNENSYVLDCFAGSGTTLLAAVNNGRKFIGIDNSNIAINTIKKRLNNIDYNYIEV